MSSHIKGMICFIPLSCWSLGLPERELKEAFIAATLAFADDDDKMGHKKNVFSLGWQQFEAFKCSFFPPLRRYFIAG